ncbi:MAG TPA: aminopeptidase P family protein, partial [candidate division Zixibacteria bacterium]|nr:aminopeptidase P family protein [candidate division Zixibacteria bacterium]
MNISAIQAYLQEHELDGWLMADFHGFNTIAMAMLKLSGMVTRRSFYFIPSSGEPTALIHAIEQDKFEKLPGKKVTFSSYKLLESSLKDILIESKKIAMEYSPMGRLPYIGIVDGG